MVEPVIKPPFDPVIVPEDPPVSVPTFIPLPVAFETYVDPVITFLSPPMYVFPPLKKFPNVENFLFASFDVQFL
jgi:hypothetical protein